MRVQSNQNQQNGNGRSPDANRSPQSSQQNRSPQIDRRIPAKRNAGLGAILKRVLGLIVEIVSIPMHIYVWLVSPQGSQLVFFLLGFLMFGLSIESYYRAAGGDVNFIVKPFIDDDASFSNLIPALSTGAFWIAAIVSLAVQTVQSWLTRDVEPDEAQADYEAVKHHTLPNHNPQGIDIVEGRRQRYKTAGTKTEVQKALLLLLVYLAIDIPANYKQYPFLAVSTDSVLPNLVYFLLALFGTEVCINLWRDARRKAKAQNRSRKVEVLN